MKIHQIPLLRDNYGYLIVCEKTNHSAIVDPSEADPVLRRTPVVVVTADVSGGAERRLRAAGADAFIAKPIDVHTLLSEVDHYLQ